MKKSFTFGLFVCLFLFVGLSGLWSTYAQVPSAGGGGGGAGLLPTGSGNGGGGETVAVTPTSAPVTVQIVPGRSGNVVRGVTYRTREVAGTVGLVANDMFPCPKFHFTLDGNRQAVGKIILTSLGNKLAEVAVTSRTADIDLRQNIPPGVTTFQWSIVTSMFSGVSAGDFTVMASLEPSDRVRLQGQLPTTAHFLFNPTMNKGNAAVWNGTVPSQVVAGLKQTLLRFALPQDNTNTEGTEWRMAFQVDSVGFDWLNVDELELVVSERGQETSYDPVSRRNENHSFRPNVMVTEGVFSGVAVSESGASAELRGRVFGRPADGVRSTVSLSADLAKWEALGERSRLLLAPTLVGPGFALDEQLGSFGTADVKVAELQGEVMLQPVFTISGAKGVAVMDIALTGEASDLPVVLPRLTLGWTGQGIVVSNVRVYRGETLLGYAKEIQEERPWWAVLARQQKFQIEFPEAIRYEPRKTAGPRLRVVCDLEGFGVGAWSLWELEGASPEGAQAVQSFTVHDAPVIVLPPFLFNPFGGFGGKA